MKRTKKLISLISVIAFLLIALVPLASLATDNPEGPTEDEGATEGTWTQTGCAPLTWEKTDDSITIVKIDSQSSGNVVIPDEIDGTRVTAIGGQAGALTNEDNTHMVDNPAITSLEIGGNVASIGTSAFYRCTGLKTLVIPDSVTTINENAFAFCTGVTSLTVGSGITPAGLSAAAFSRMMSLTEINIRCNAELAVDTVSPLNNLQIRNSITKLTIGGKATSVPREVRGFKSLQTVSLGSGITTMGNGVLSECPALTSVTIPSSVNSIGNNAFQNDTALSSVTIQGGNTSLTLSPAVFANCDSLTKLTIPGRVTSLGENAFFECDNLEEVTLEEGVDTLGDGAFSHDPKLTKVSIPVSLTKIGKDAFALDVDKPNDIINIYYAGDKEQWEKLMEASNPVAFVGDKVWMNGMTEAPSQAPSSEPQPTSTTTTGPDGQPTTIPTTVPSTGPVPVPTAGAPALPSVPTTSSAPIAPAPTAVPTSAPSSSASASAEPTSSESAEPTTEPSGEPSTEPTSEPSGEPSTEPSAEPSAAPPVEINPDAADVPADVEIVTNPEGEGSILTGVAIGTPEESTTVETVASWIEAPEGGTVDLVDADGNPADPAAPVGTGMVIEVRDARGIVIQSTTVVVKGDVTGTGEMNLTQLVRLAEGMTGADPLTGAYLDAADLNGDGQITLTDLVQEARMYVNTGL